MTKNIDQAYPSMEGRMERARRKPEIKCGLVWFHVFKVGGDVPMCTCLRKAVVTEGEDEDAGGRVGSHRRRMSGIGGI